MSDGLQLLSAAWLLLLVPVSLLLWWLWRRPVGRGPWSQVVDVRLQPLLLRKTSGRGQRHIVAWLGLAWVLAVLALANPAWERRPQPLLDHGASRVLVLELSRSMFADDVRPTRLVQARLKIEDLIDSESAGQTGLVAYAGDAFTVTPLTRDAETLRALLRVLEPDIMPVQGSRLDLALAQAHRLLAQSGVDHGEVIVIADGTDEVALSEAEQLARAGHQVSVLGVGAPGVAGAWQAPAFEVAALRGIAEAGGGRFTTLSADGTDIRELVRGGAHRSIDASDGDLTAETWQGRGPLLVLLLIPLAAMAFRRGWLTVWVAAAVLYQPTPPAIASTWDDLWLRPDQQAARALAEGDYGRVTGEQTDPLVRGAAKYRQGDYQAALSAYRDSNGAEAAYNQGNALAMLGQYRAAVDAYDHALTLEPSMEDAQFNKRIVEGLLARRDQSGDGTDNPQTPETPEPQSSHPETAQQAADAETSPSDQASPANEGADDGEVTSASDMAQADQEAGEQTGSETAEATPSDSQAGEQTGEAASAGDQQLAGDQASDLPAEGDSRHHAQAQGGVEPATAEQAGVESGVEEAQGGTRDEVGDGLAADMAADAAGQENEATDRSQAAQTPSPDNAEEAGRVASRETDDASASGDDRASPSPETQDPGESGQSQNADRQENLVGRSFAEANQRLAERGEAQPDGEGELPDPGPTTPAAGHDPTAAPGPGADGEDPRDSMAAGSEWSTEERLAAEQWLRRIPDDPGGLLRRKFLYQYRERQRAIDGSRSLPR